MKALFPPLFCLISFFAYSQNSTSIPAQYPGGDIAFFEYLKTNLHYPADALKDSTQGIVFIEFTVSTSGQVGSVNVVKGIKTSCDNEAKRLITQSIAWGPAKQNNIVVDKVIVFPVKFELRPGFVK